MKTYSVGRKYKLRLDLKLVVCGTILYRIERCATGDLGGYIEKETNLSQNGDAWVFGDARVSGDARVFGNSKISSIKEIINIIVSFAFSVTITPDNIVIGCRLKKRNDWLKITMEEAEGMGLPRKLYPHYKQLVKAGMKLVPARKKEKK